MADLARTQVTAKSRLSRLLRLSLATWLVAFVPALIREFPGLRMSFDLSQSMAILGQTGLALAAATIVFAIFVHAAVGILLKATRLGHRITSAQVVGVILGFIAIATSFRTVQLWLGEFWYMGRPIRSIVEFWTWIALLVASLVVLRLEPARRIFGVLVRGSSQIATVVLIAMSLSWVNWYPNYFRSSPKPASDVANDATGRPNIVLITIDTLSAKNVSLLGYKRQTTPNLERFAERATVFTDTISSSNFTTPGVAAIMTGRYGTRNGMHHLGSRLYDADLYASVPGQLHLAGYELAAFVGNNWAHPANFGLDPFFQELPFTEMRSPSAWPYIIPTVDSKLNGMGLWHFLFIPWTVRLGQLPWWNSESPYRVEEIFERASHFLVSRVDHRPLFLWVHVFPPHSPYLPPSPYRGRFLRSDEMQTFSAQEMIPYGQYGFDDIASVGRLRDRYDENISYVDAHLGKFLDDLRDAGLLSTSYVIITSDHGESFERAWRGHHVPALHQALIHVPLVIYSPSSRSAARLGIPVQTVDVAPTIMDIAGVRHIPPMDGRSLRPSIDGMKQAGDDVRYAMWLQDTPDYQCPESGIFAVFEGTRKLVWNMGTDRTALYNLAVDPDEYDPDSTGAENYIAQMKDRIVQDLLDCGKFHSSQ